MCGDTRLPLYPCTPSTQNRTVVLKLLALGKVCGGDSELWRQPGMCVQLRYSGSYWVYYCCAIGPGTDCATISALLWWKSESENYAPCPTPTLAFLSQALLLQAARSAFSDEDKTYQASTQGFSKQPVHNTILQESAARYYSTQPTSALNKRFT